MPDLQPHSDRERDPSHRHQRSDRRRSRSRGRRRRHSSRHRRRRHQKVSERNFAAAACSMLAIVATCIGLGMSECFTFHGGNCHDEFGVYLPSIGIRTFFFSGHFVNSSSYHFQSFGRDHYLHNCTDSQTVSIMKVILSMCVLSTIFTLVAFVMDLIGPKKSFLMILRRNGVLNVISVFLLVIAFGFSYWAAILFSDNLHLHKRAKGSRVEVGFGASYYVLVGAAVANILATAFNLLRRYPPRLVARDQQTQPIINDVDFLIDEPTVPPSVMVREPPPYAP